MRKLFFILLICNMLFVNAQSLELENWKIINSSELNAGAAEVSQLSYPTAEWYQATVPTTVLNALVKENVFIKFLFADDTAAGKRYSRVGILPAPYRGNRVSITETNVKSKKNFYRSAKIRMLFSRQIML